MWPYCVNLLHQGKESFLAALGTTGLGWWVQGIIWFFATEIATYLAVWLFRGRSAMTSRVAENFGIGLFAWIIVMACVYTPIFAWNVIKVAYTEYNDLVIENKRLSTAQVDPHLVDPQGRDNKIRNLETQIDQFRKSQSPVMKVFPIAHDSKPGVPKLEYLLASGKIRTPVDLMVECDTAMSDIDLMPLTTGGGGAAFGENRQQISATKYELSMQSPAWSPSSPLWVTIFFTPPVNAMPHCSFTTD